MNHLSVAHFRLRFISEIDIYLFLNIALFVVDKFETHARRHKELLERKTTKSKYPIENNFSEIVIEMTAISQQMSEIRRMMLKKDLKITVLKKITCNSFLIQVLKGMGPFLRSQRKAVTHHGHSYALSVNAECQKPFRHSVKIFGVLQ